MTAGSFEVSTLPVGSISCARTGRLAIALEKCDAQLEKVGDAPVARAIIHNLKGSLFLAQKNTDAAEKAFGTAIQENPDFLPPYYALARIYLATKQEQKAIDQYLAILEKNPNQAGPHMLLGTIYDMQKNVDKSEEHYRAALKINPQFAPAANNLAYLLSSRDGNIDEALKFAQIAKEKLPDDPSVMDTLGWIYYKKGLYGNAIQELSDSLQKLPDNALVNFHLGAAFFKRGDTAKAKPLLEKALSLDETFDGADDAKVRKALMTQYGIEIGAGLGALAGKVWRVGLMGHSCNVRNVLLCLSAFETVLAGEGAEIERGAAQSAALAQFNS